MFPANTTPYLKQTPGLLLWLEEERDSHNVPSGRMPAFLPSGFSRCPLSRTSSRRTPLLDLTPSPKGLFKVTAATHIDKDLQPQ